MINIAKLTIIIWHEIKHFLGKFKIRIEILKGDSYNSNWWNFSMDGKGWRRFENMTDTNAARLLQGSVTSNEKKHTQVVELKFF